MKITVCIGSTCHIKGARLVVEKLQDLIARYGLGDRVELSGSFCTGNCQSGVCVTVDGRVCSVLPDTVEDFFEKQVLAKENNGL